MKHANDFGRRAMGSLDGGRGKARLTYEDGSEPD